MSNINFNLNSNKDDYNTLKEAIFRRAREKAEALNSELKASYTSDIKNDVMESARMSVRNNPFMNLFEEEDEVDTEVFVNSLPKKEIKHSLDFHPKRQRRLTSKLNNELYSAAVRDTAMRDASEALRQNKNIMQCLTFLNTQAAIALNKPFSIKAIEEAPKEIGFGL